MGLGDKPRRACSLLSLILFGDSLRALCAFSHIFALCVYMCVFVVFACHTASVWDIGETLLWCHVWCAFFCLSMGRSTGEVPSPIPHHLCLFRVRGLRVVRGGAWFARMELSPVICLS